MANYIVKKASAESSDQLAAIGLTGIPGEWPIESYPYVGQDIPSGFIEMSDDDITILKTNNQAAYDAWLYSKQPLPQPRSPLPVVTAYEVNDKDLRLARSMAQVDGTGTALISIKIPGTFGAGPGRYIAGGYLISEDYNRNDFAICWTSDEDRNIAWMIALAQNPSATQPVADAVIQGMGIVPGIGIAMPAYPVVKSFCDVDYPIENQGWYFWANAIGNNVQANGEIEIEPIAGYGFLPSGLYFNAKYCRPNGITTGSVRLNLFWGVKE